MRALVWVYRKIKKQEPPYFFHYSPRTILLKPIRKWVTNVVAANCPFNSVRILLYRLCGFKIGKHVFIGMRCYLDGMCYDLMKIGNYVIISYGAYFACHGKGQGHYPIVVEDYAYIGMRANVISKEPGRSTEDAKRGITIGKHAVVGACTLVNRDIPDYATAIGVPCRIVEQREERLTNE